MNTFWEINIECLLVSIPHSHDALPAKTLICECFDFTVVFFPVLLYISSIIIYYVSHSTELSNFKFMLENRKNFAYFGPLAVNHESPINKGMINYWKIWYPLFEKGLELLNRLRRQSTNVFKYRIWWIYWMCKLIWCLYL